MRINHEEKGDLQIFRVVGDIDINTSPELKKTIDKKISNKKNTAVINLQDVNYVDSSGLATLVEILKHLRAYKGRLRLSNLNEKVKGLFEITKLDKLFEIFKTEEEALSK